MINRKDLTIEEIKELMQPLHSANHNHTLLINPSEGKRGINLALLRWAGGARQVTLTQFELPPDAVGRIYTVDTFIGEVVDIRYADWAKHVRKGKYVSTGTSHTKGKYKTFPHVMLDYIDGSKKRRHYRPMVHSIMAYVYPHLREQYAVAILRDMQDKDRTFLQAQAQVNHMDRDTRNNSIYNLEAVTASENGKHWSKTKIGVPYSAICDRDKAPEDLLEFEDSGIMDARKAYIDKLCKHLSAANIAPDTGVIAVKTVQGKFIELPIKDLSVWSILALLFTTQAVAVLK